MRYLPKGLIFLWILVLAFAFHFIEDHVIENVYADSVIGTMWKQEDTIIYPADDVTKVDFNNLSAINMLGGGGVTEGSDVGFGNITATRIDATTGVFGNITGFGSIRLNSPSFGNYFNVFDGFLSVLGTTGGNISLDPGAAISTLKCASVNCVLQVDNTNKYLRLGQLLGFSTAGFFVDIAGKHTNSSGEYVHTRISPIHNGSGTENHTDLFLNATTITEGSGTDYFLKAANNNVEKYYIDYDGSVAAAGIKTAFRNLSSATETLTSADYFINCLANDNEVVITMPAIDANYSQTLMVKYTDSGSTNKCKLDGNGAEQVEGFTVYTSLDTYLEGVILKSDGTAWWITGGI